MLPDILNIHTHGDYPQLDCVINIAIRSGESVNIYSNQFYSVGIHPWDVTDGGWTDMVPYLEKLANMPEIVAIGESGLDTKRGGPLIAQIMAFREHIELSEITGKPLIIHDVKAHENIIAMRKDYKPMQEWIIHGFRGNANVAKMLTDAGCMLSFSEFFNADALRATDKSLILAETDESKLDIATIIHNLSEAYGEDLTATIAQNSARALHLRP